MEPKTNHIEMVVVDDFVVNGISMFSLMEPKIILAEMRMINDFQVLDRLLSNPSWSSTKSHFEVVTS